LRLTELADRLVVRDPRVLVADRDREELEKSLGRFGSDVGNDRWNFGTIRLCEGPKCALTLAPQTGSLSRHIFAVKS
jgi:hypothetical protein